MDGVFLNYNENAEVKRELIPGNVRCIHGHFPSTHYDRFFPDADLVAWLRNPVERVVSNYHQFLRHPDPANPCSRELSTKRLSLEQFAELTLMRNEASRYIAGKPPEAFKFIGILERFDESLKVFGAIFNVPVPDVSPRMNANVERAEGRYPISDRTYQRILSLNLQDRLIYDQANARLDAWLARSRSRIA
jgi:hypothetical protein